MKGKYLQIFNYLLEFSKIRSKSVRDIETPSSGYIERLWLNDIPENSLFENIIRSDNFNFDNDYWLKIGKPKEPNKPEFATLSEPLKTWVELDSLLIGELTPILRKAIKTDDGNVSIEDYPDIKQEFQIYVESQWGNDLKEYSRKLETYNNDYALYKSLNAIYTQVFRIYNKSQQFGEEYELLMGVGLLNFKTDAPRIYRHVMTQGARAHIRYDNNKNLELLISPNEDSFPTIEIDSIIDFPVEFDQYDIIAAKNKAEEFLNDDRNEISTVFDEKIHDALKIFSHRFYQSSSDYIEQLKKPIQEDKSPKVYFSPVLLLRKRNTKSLTALYENIISNIGSAEDSINIPSINDLINDGDDEVNPQAAGTTQQTIYFPKEFNDEQIAIAEKARWNNKVLVQGPPGTGKSHTIANLICHLLANGNKVLVTAYTPRALEVLKKKLPEDFQDLTVSLLGGDSSSIQGLDKNVNSISSKASQANLPELKLEIEELENELSKARERKAFNFNELIYIKEQSIRIRSVNAFYKGTLLGISEQLEFDAGTFKWYTDSFADIENTTIVSDISKLIELVADYDEIDVTDFHRVIPNVKNLPTVEQLKRHKETSNRLVLRKTLTDEHFGIVATDYSELARMLRELADCYTQASAIRNDVTNRLIKPYLNGNTEQFKEKISSASNILHQIESIDLEGIDSDIEITYISPNSLKQLKNDAHVLLSYLEKGHALHGVSFSFKSPFLPTQIKQRLYFINEVKVNGSHCNIKKDFESVIRDIELQQNFEKISKLLWNIPVQRTVSYLDKFMYLNSFILDAQNLFNIIDESEALRLSIESASNLQLVAFDKTSVDRLVQESEYNELQQIVKSFDKVLEQANSHLKQDNIHPIAQNILSNIENIDVDSYDKTIGKLGKIVEQKKRYFDFKELKRKLEEVLPNLITHIFSDEYSPSDVRQLQQAVYYRHAHNKVHKLMDIAYEQKISASLTKAEQQEKELISTIASNKAWVHVLERLQSNRSLGNHLQAFSKAVRLIGRTGVGQRAARFIKIAQQEMGKCKAVVPCWIMPFYKVIESIQPEQGMYDYVIIDEASQLGADAIFLLYIAKKIIIVGDDKQTSPEYIGLAGNAMAPYITQHLNGIPFKDFYSTEFSFFDHAAIFCDEKIVLREHFRCMPEIIEFCNENFYKHDGIGLYPLKQYSENRLEPLINIYCQDGYVEGQASSITNEPEAKKLVDAIDKLTKDKRYDGKSFGVITLQGNKQSEIIEALLLKKIGEVEFKERNIVCGNSTSFQGDERDIIFLSMVTAHNHNRTALTTPGYERRFNVAVSRAKEQIWLFHSVQLADLRNQNDLRYKLLNHFENYRLGEVIGNKTITTPPRPRPLNEQPAPFDSWFEVDVYNDIILAGHGVIAQYEVAKGKYKIDLVLLLPNGTKIAIECDGDYWHSAEQYQRDMMRQRELERFGWQFFRVRGSSYYANRKKALEPLWEMLPDLASVPTEPTKNKEPEVLPVSPPQVDKPYEGQADLFSEPSIVNNNTQRARPRKRQEPLKATGEFLVFTNQFNVYKFKDSGCTKTQALEKVKVKFEQGEKQVCKTIQVKEYSGFLILSFENGKMAKVNLVDYATQQNTSRLKNAYNNCSKLVSIGQFKAEIDLVATSTAEKILVFNTEKLIARGRKSQGVKVMSLNNGSKLSKVKKLSDVRLSNPEHYRFRNLGARGNNLVKGDIL